MNKLNTLKKVLAFLICVDFVLQYLLAEYKHIILPMGVVFFALFIIVSVYGWFWAKKTIKISVCTDTG